MIKKHDLFDFFQQANINIASEYDRISRNAKEDPGTAGDQGELNWKSILELWLPPYFQVVTKGRIINEKGDSSPQMDLIVLSPEYPKQLLECKRYLSKGVVAAFECKTTLRKDNIREVFENSKSLHAMLERESGSPRKELQSPIFYGLLAHSHEWKKDKSRPAENITKAIMNCFNSEVDHPIEMPDIFCVADVGVWNSFKAIIPPQPDIYPEDPEKRQALEFDKLTIRAGYCGSMDNSELYTPVGELIFKLLEEMAWKYPRMRDICSYMQKLNIEGSAQGTLKSWNPSTVLSREIIKNIGLLNTGRRWDNWGMVVKW